MDNNYISIREFANRANISRQKAYKLSNDNLKSFCKVIGDKKVISVSALDNTDVLKDDNCISKNTKNTENAGDILALLSRQLEIKDKQIEEKDIQLNAKDKQIEELQQLLKLSQEQQLSLSQSLTNSQALHAGTIKEHIDNKTTKKRLFSWIFKKS